MLIAAVDPGLDLVAAAVFDLAAWHPSHRFEKAATSYKSTHTQETSPRAELHDRLCVLRDWAATCFVDVCRVYVEKPALFGAYGRNRHGRSGNMIPEGLALLNMAMGALLAGFAADPRRRVVMVPAPKIPKPRRHIAVEAAMKDVGHVEFARGPRGGKQHDVLDATFLGLYVLTHPELRPQPLAGIGSPAKFPDTHSSRGSV